MGSAALKGVTSLTPLDRQIVLDSLYERVMKDCSDAARHVTLVDILGCLETIKLSFYRVHYMDIATHVTNEMRGGMTEQ
jgi:hypothetical protein